MRYVRKLINIYNLCYNTAVLKKITKTFTNCSFRTVFGQKLGQQRPCPKSSSIFFWRWQKVIISFQELFILSEYHKFWLSYEWFSVLYDVLLPKLAISGWNRRTALPWIHTVASMCWHMLDYGLWSQNSIIHEKRGSAKIAWIKSSKGIAKVYSNIFANKCWFFSWKYWHQQN